MYHYKTFQKDMESLLFAWFLSKDPGNFLHNYIFIHFSADFGPHSDSKFGANIPKMVIVPNDSHQNFLERYDKPLLLTIYLIPSHNCRKLSQISFLHFSSVFNTSFDPKFSPNALEMDCFALIMPILSRTCSKH